MTRLDTLTWCRNLSGYADERCTRDTSHQHDHYDLVVDWDAGPGGNARVLYRMDPVGTVYRTADGEMWRLRRYDDDPFAEPPIGPVIPNYDVWRPSGGATSYTGTYTDATRLWDGDRLHPGVARVLPGVPDGPVPTGSIYVRPNGETWRLRDYRVSLSAEPYTGLPTETSWTVQYPSGGASTAEGRVPVDARLMWVP